MIHKFSFSTVVTTCENRESTVSTSHRRWDPRLQSSEVNGDPPVDPDGVVENAWHITGQDHRFQLAFPSVPLQAPQALR
ncbi:MAG: hypothetical protein O7C75_06800, partial [Verrucomicrobia bacterium]|nr:hypothetical protein [Verrucomicrobiota bacterium]